jgi:hypothetical protein
VTQTSRHIAQAVMLELVVVVVIERPHGKYVQPVCSIFHDFGRDLRDVFAFFFVLVESELQAFDVIVRDRPDDHSFTHLLVPRRARGYQVP